MSPKELLLKAKESSLFALSITDHDTIQAYPEAVTVAKEMGILLGSGIEFSCHYNGSAVHLLGYDFLLDSPYIDLLITKHKTRRWQRNQAILEKLRKKGMVIAESELSAKGGVGSTGRPHIAQLLVEKKYVTNVQEAFHLYLGEGKSCYEMGPEFLIEEAIEALHRAEGKAFLAHPHLLPKTVSTKKLLDFPFDGIECYYSLFSKEVCNHWLKIAKERNLLVSGGSDFHGAAKPQIHLGSSFVGEEEFFLIFQKLVK